MCRTGGRRCPSYSDPAAIAARNARRRAAYAARKAARKVQETASQGVAESVAGEAAEAAQNAAEIGVSSTPVEAELHYAPQVVRGIINHKALKEGSYREFGFTDPSEEKPLYARHQIDYDVSSIYTEEESERECEPLSDEESLSLRYFTTRSYLWINEKLYQPEKLREMPAETTEMREKAEKLVKTLRKTEEEDETRSLLREITTRMDAALAKGPGKQRFLYRGISATEILDAAEDPYNPIPARTVEQWVDENRSLGTEVVFDGYTSATARASATRAFQKGVVYEILTPQGVAISSLSALSFEDEVLLPRKQRYMVVGVHKGQPFDDFERGTIIQLVAINSKGEVLDGTNADPIEPVDVELQ